VLGSEGRAADNTPKRSSWPFSLFSGRFALNTNYPYTTQMGFPGSGLGSGIEETPAAEGFFGERGGTRTLDPMIKSHVLNPNPKFAV
jgi:hypothetical protein